MALPEIATPINKAAVDAARLELCTDMMGNAALAPPLTPETTLLQWTGADEAIMTRLSAYLTKQGF
jgi:hypothetical protein